MGYSFRLAARILLYALSHIQDNTYHNVIIIIITIIIKIVVVVVVVVVVASEAAAVVIVYDAVNTFILITVKKSPSYAFGGGGAVGVFS